MIDDVWLCLAALSYNNDIISGVLLYPEYTVRITQASCVLLHGERGEITRVTDFLKKSCIASKRIGFTRNFQR